MSIAQAAQIVAMAVILPLIFRRMGYQWTLAIATLMWIVMFMTYARMKPRSAIIASMALHGLAYAFFFDAGFLYMGDVAPPEIRGSAQALYNRHTGAWPLRRHMDHGRGDGSFRTAEGLRLAADVLVPCFLLIVCMLAFVFIFRGEVQRQLNLQLSLVSGFKVSWFFMVSRFHPNQDQDRYQDRLFNHGTHRTHGKAWLCFRVFS